LIEVRPYSPPYAVAGCAAVCVTCSLAFVAIGLGLIGVAAGIVAGFLITRLVLGWIKRRWPRPPSLVPHDLRTYPENLPPLAEFLDQIAAAAEWTPDFDKRLDTAKKSRTYDDWLEDVAIDFAKQYRDIVRGTPPRKRRAIEHTFSPEELRAELRAIARDLRLAAK
jgi:hypothetical protein